MHSDFVNKWYKDFQFIAVHDEHSSDIVNTQYTDFQFIVVTMNTAQTL